VATLKYNSDDFDLHAELDDDPIGFVERLRAWAEDDRRQALLPPLLRRHADRLLRPKLRGRRPVPDIVRAVVALEYSAATKPRDKALAGRWGVAPPTVRGWALLARERGYLDDDGPTQQARGLRARDDRSSDEIMKSWLARAV
jgi:hypothetical protein